MLRSGNGVRSGYPKVGSKLGWIAAKWLMLTMIALGILSGPALAGVHVLENDVYRIQSSDGLAFTVTNKAAGTTAQFTPSFIIVHNSANPRLGLAQSAEKGGMNNASLNYMVPAWNGQTNFFAAEGTWNRLEAEQARWTETSIEWDFGVPTLSARLILPAGGAPTITYELRPDQRGYYSVGFVGAPEVPTARADWMWQPLIWQDQRFPLDSYMTLEFRAPLPVVLVNTSGTTIGVAADPAEIPYRLPTRENSRFGFVLRNENGNMQPMIFAPVYGGAESLRSAGESYTFRLRLVVDSGDWYTNYRQLAYDWYGFSDYRENSICTLNDTLDNLIDYVLTDEYSYWYPEFKTNGYQQDRPGYGRQQSAAYALSLALVRDSREFYERRALPTMEYMVSRKNQYFSFERYEPTYGMGGPVADSTVDLVATYLLTGRRTPALRILADENRGFQDNYLWRVFRREDALDNAKRFLRNILAIYRLNGNPRHLTLAKNVADEYIKYRLELPAIDYRDAYSSFWSEIGPMWDILYELYVETGEEKYLEAAIAGLRQFTGYVYLQPPVPDEMIRVNTGGVVRGMPAPEEVVPAWRVSANGLTAEAGGTSHSHRGIFMTPYAAYMATAAYDAEDDFFRDIARSAQVGRYCNYPSYAYRHFHTTVFEKPDYPLRPFEEMTFTTVHYNHPLPQAAFIVDYLVSETFYRSKGAISFPSQYTSTGAYFRSRVYGDRPGTFYGDENVWLWLPKGLLTTDNVQVNYIAGHGNGKLYLALQNQSAEPITATVRLNPERVAFGSEHAVQVWEENEHAGERALRDGAITVNIAPKGITGLIIDGVGIRSDLQEDYISAPDDVQLSDASYQTIQTPWGRGSAMIMSVAPTLTSAFVYLEAGPQRVAEATLHYNAGDGWHAVTDAGYPFEFTVPLLADTETFTFYIEGTTPDGVTDQSEEFTLAVFVK